MSKGSVSYSSIVKSGLQNKGLRKSQQKNQSLSYERGLAF
ncbi:hypothetical protein RV11_GL000013 [Enterococcus phoeniculicola]|nr:hypothetical protein RV11_GL000013 [Enterococcus phoeniculicola]